MRHMQNRPGFSLMDAMIALGLLAIIVTLVMLNAAFMHKALVRSEVDKLHSVCTCMQATARMSNQKQEMHIDRAHNVYTYAGHKERLPSQVRFGVLPTVKGPPSAPQRLLTSPITFDKQCITCSAHGIMNSGTVYITDRDATCLYALSSAVAHYSYIRKYAYDGAWHPLR